MENKYLIKAKIYTIRSPQTDEIYIGSTIDSLAKRFYKHKSNLKAYQNGKYRYTTSFKLLEKYDDCYIELLENYPCVDKNELQRREGELIRVNNNKCVNKKIEGRTPKQYKEDYKDKIKEQAKQYYQDNKQVINTYHKQRYQGNKEEIKKRAREKHNCECGGKFTQGSKSKHEKTKRHLLYMINKIENENQ